MNIKFLSVVLIFILGFKIQAQEVTYKGTKYKVKKESVIKDNVDVSHTLNEKEKKEIKKALKEQQKEEKELKKAAKKQKKTEKTVKKQEGLQAKYNKAEKKYEDAVNKYEKLKNKGKLSPNDENDWLNKIDKLKAKHEKAKSKL